MPSHSFFSLFYFIFSSLQLAEEYFDLQPSWFDTLSKNVGCLEVENYPVTARDLEAIKTDSSTQSKLSAEAAKGIKRKTYKVRLHTLDRLCELGVVFSISWIKVRS